MNLKVKYFGMIAEALGKESEVLHVNFLTVDQLQQHYRNKIKNVNYKIAVNHNLVDGNYLLKENDEVALLPPFAGG